MSRVGLSPIKLPSGVDVSIDGALLTFSSVGVSKTYQLSGDGVTIQKIGDFLQLAPSVRSGLVKNLLGLHRSLIKNIVVGLSEGFRKDLVVVGVGYKVALTKKYLIVSIGYSHDIYYVIPNGIFVEVIKDGITIKSNDKMLLGSVVVDICSFRKFDPYKGKGIYIKGEFLLRKQAKKK